jgi:enamine deaminase RidA (YjgF/YER057c/UK114 family)
MATQRLGSGSPWEDVVGYSRVVRTGDLVFVSGTTGTRDGVLVDGGITEQTRQALENVVAALARVGASTASSSATTARPPRWSRSRS